MTRRISIARTSATIGLTILMLAVSVGVPTRSAEARVFVGVGIGAPFWGGYYPYAYPYPYTYYYPPAYAYPPAYYPPAAQPAQPQAMAPSGYSTSNCRDYNSTQSIDGRPQNITGTACLQSDGTWRIVK